VEEQASIEARMSEWGNLPGRSPGDLKGRERREVKHLSTCRKRNQTRCPE